MEAMLSLLEERVGADWTGAGEADGLELRLEEEPVVTLSFDSKK